MKAKIIVAQNGLDIDERAIVDHVDNKSVCGKFPKRFILNIGTYDRNKSHDLLLRSFKNVVQYHDTMLVIIGAIPHRGSTFEDVVSLTEELGIIDRVRLVANLPHAEVMEYIERADLFVLPSRREGLPISLLEAGYFGLPVIATNVGGIPELIEHNVTGLLMSPDDEAALSGHLDALISDENLQRRLGDALRARVLSSFTSEITYRKYKSLI